MTDKQPSAEKDLLKLIENPGEADLKKLELAVGSPLVAEPGKKMSFFSFSKKDKKANAKKSPGLKVILFGRKQILRVLFAVTLCVFAYFIMTVAREYSKLKDTKKLVNFTYISEGKEARVTGQPAADFKTAADNAIEAETAGIRNIFKPDSAKKEEAKKDEATIVLNDYRLVGISFSPDPKETYAMVKNAKSNITFFLKKGEKLDGMELVNIFDNKVTLKVGGKEVELR